jgi:ferredoxin-type protein NapH
MSDQREIPAKKKPPHNRAWPAAYVFSFFLVSGAILWLILKMPSYLFLMGSIGFFAALGLFLHRTLGRSRKPVAHTISLLAIGAGLFFGAGVFGRQNEQLEGFFFDVLLGLAGGALVHYLVAKIIGPLLVGRLWCGWGCWTFSLMNLLPFKKSRGKAANAPYSPVRTYFFLASLALVYFLVRWLGYSPGGDWKTTKAHLWFIGGNVLYFVSGAVLAFLYRDNRAFCKILCPVTVLLKLSGRFSLLKIGRTSVPCNSCGACVKRCPMNIDIPAYIANGKRVLSSECVLCRQCVATCPYGSVDLTLGFDSGRKDLFADLKSATAEPAEP